MPPILGLPGHLSLRLPAMPRVEDRLTLAQGMRDEVLAALLAPAKELSRDEPEVAANIGIQIEHMGLETWSISVRRRIRDAVAKLEPKRIIEAGAGIGHLTAWLLDHFSGGNRPDSFQIVEEGNRFAVILARLCERYSDSPSRIIVGRPSTLVAEARAWNLAGAEIGDAPIGPKADCIIVHAQLATLSVEISALLTMLSPNGVLFTVEPTPPVGERDDSDPEVVGFNSWMELIRTTNDTHHLAFSPLFGGTIVAWLPRQD